MLPAVALAAVMAAGCARSPRTVAPTGWRSFGEPYDSLTLLLETGFVGDAGADSLGNMARRLAEAAAAPGAPDGLEGRGHFWRGRVASRRGDEEVRRSEMALAAGGSGDEAEYLRRRMAWLEEDKTGFSNVGWYRHLLDEIDYYAARRDSVMLYTRYVELTDLMREAGFRDRAAAYLALADSCGRAIAARIPFPGMDINRACLLYEVGLKEEAGEVFRRLSGNDAAMADPSVSALVDYNLYSVYGDTSALRRACATLESSTDYYSLYPIVSASVAGVALRRGDRAEAALYARRARQGVEALGQADHRLMALRVIAEAAEASDDAAAAARAYKDYALAADSVRRVFSDGEVVTLETRAMIEEADREYALRLAARRRNLWAAVCAAVAVAVCAVFYALRRMAVLRRSEREAVMRHREAERQTMVMRIASDIRENTAVEAVEHLLRLEAAGALGRADSRRLVRLLREGKEEGTSPDDFRELFSRVRPEFIGRLREIAPALSDQAVKLACYTLLGLDTREIAAAMNVRPESVKQARWRLRKALRVPAGESLHLFLRSLG